MKDFPVKDGWGVITGVVDGAIVEGTDKAQLVGMILTLISNPKKTATDVAGFAKGVVTDWDKTKELITGLGTGIIGYDSKDFEEGQDPVYKGRGIGKVGGTLAMQALTGGVVFLQLIKNAPQQLDNLAVRVANKLARIKQKLRDTFSNWSDADIDKFADEIAAATDDDLLPNGCNVDCAVGKYGCFTAQTPIETQQANTFMPANEVVKGMEIMSYNHTANRKEPQLVTAVKRYLVSGLMILGLSNGETIETTPNHPFYVRNHYENAENLLQGDTLFTARNEWVILNQKAVKDTTVEVFNFTVANNNNYFVGQAGVLVHNVNCLLDNIKNNFPNLGNKLDGLADELKAKFLKDFEGIDDDFLRVLDNGNAFKAWEKLSEITGPTKTWIAQSKAILERVNTKNLSSADRGFRYGWTKNSLFKLIN